jgi:NAD(P)-dependent dehydrogenase (short-subunit alcohol dehydrogenase family)
MRLENKVAIVTGGGTGIGKAIAYALFTEGAAVVVAARNLPRLEAVVADIRSKGGRATAIQTDISVEEQVKNMVAKTLDKYGQIDMMINNAGITGPTVEVANISLDKWNEVLDINLTGAMLCSREVLQNMIERRSGSIVNISSKSGQGAHPMRSPYCASKWGMIGLTQTLAQEVGKYNIRVNCIAPGFVPGERIERVMRARAESTGIPYEEVMSRAQAGHALGRTAVAEEIASTVVFLVSDDSSGITGHTISVNAGS